MHHLNALEKAKILSVRRQGRLALCKVDYQVVLDALQNLRQLIDEDLEIMAQNRPGKHD